MPKHRKSQVWEFFTRCNNQNCKCNLCGRIYKTGGGTTNLNNHLIRKHPKVNAINFKKHVADEARVNKKPRIDFDLTNSTPSTSHSNAEGGDAAKEIENEALDSQHEDSDDSFEENLIEVHSIGSASTITASSTSNINYNGSNSSHLSQPSIHQIFNAQRCYESGGSKEAMLTQALIFMICKDNYPLQCTEKEGLKRLLKVAVPLYHVPSRSTITKYVEQKYNSLQIFVSKKLQQAHHLALTTDIATVINATRSFIVLTAHFINEENNEMVTIALGVSNLTQHHTADNISNDLHTMLNNWKILKENIVSITTDNGANIVAAVKKIMSQTSNHFHVSCFAHNINLVITKALGSCPDVVTIIEKVKTIVAYFKHSNVAQDQLRYEQKNEGKKDGTYLYLIQEVPTRWNSTFYCLQRFKYLSGHVGKILLSSEHQKAPPMLTANELAIIDECLKLLGPFEDATKNISGEKYVSGSLVIPMTNCIKTSLHRINVSNPFAKNLKKELEAQIEKKLDPLETNILLSIATIVDPRFKRLHFSSARNVANAITIIKNEVKKEHQNQGSLTPPVHPNIIDDVDGCIWNIHDEIASRHLPDSDGCDGLPAELKLYLNQPIQPRTRHPIQYWKENKNAFPGTYKIAMKYLTVLGASVPAERLVSTLNNVCSDKRSRLTPQHINELVFLNSLDSIYWNI
ncbi:zinc finger BED domain-containing protein 4-like [Zophobas morio]|uniref:zinc finger BED domain-containing protein 4-like n=1 Tax=Zophobas morio TaxID=2755281 RepID=UPI0030830996